MRHVSPIRPIRLHRFNSPKLSMPQRLLKRARHLPLVVPLCAGLTVAGLLDAALPGKEAVAPVAMQEAVAVAVAVSFNGNDDSSQANGADDGAHDVLTPPPTVATAPAPAAPAVSVHPVEAPAPRVFADAAPMAAPSTHSDALEARIQAMLEQGKTPYSAVVVLEAATGRVVAVAEHSTRGDATGLALRPMAPAASVFKIITASALLEAGVPTSEPVCYSGGKTRMRPKNLQNSKRDNRCTTFADVVSQSANVAVAKLASSHLTPGQLRQHTTRWGFGSTNGVAGLTPSHATIPDDPFAFAEAAAGFGDVKISAMHGAMIASIVANDGKLVTPSSRLDQAPQATRAIDPRTARALKRMMTDTVVKGTARRSFSQKPALGRTAAGKTGSLTDYKTGLDTSWFVGFAPAEDPEFIVAAVVVNTGIWHIKAPWLAKETLRLAFKDPGSTTRGSKVAAR